MKIQQLALSFRDQDIPSSSLSLSFKSLHQRSPETLVSLNLQSFNSPKSTKCIIAHNTDNSPIQSGGKRWNPTQEQIKVLEALYKDGMRTPTAQQIEQITCELGQHGRIEGKNVFYWFQNHKARERQKQKRSVFLALSTNPSDNPLLFSDSKGESSTVRELGFLDGSCKRKCRSWNVEFGVEEGGGDGTLELFPLRPERVEDEILR